ncbi:isocitrate lyase/phosphoenolpyruvate mutase family protein [Pedobacter petrophilus]|uniref:Isocitrate lyase/phosphoenolpyruvate mutase family protein n=1 Tax=Pedobacter petrophilus TaxID=1908241 RepID=A0A7K0G661_9SPHI|nr:isocitrate lyase/phosphoenolpyruvate mutase family protein [Pedobacter petrophilus]MRX78834.1 isocitrate lyase/phosphoenolpyruvate mutase family protein [Pedobacter petrophilus]
MKNLNVLSQITKATAFLRLHQRNGVFIIPNPWDAGSAKVLEHLGFEALATTSAGLAFCLGLPDGHASLTRELTLANASSIINSTRLPVAADLENGYGDDPLDCAKTITLAAHIGLCGGSIEDATGKPNDPIYPFKLAVERIKAAVQAKQDLSVPFTLTARAENLIYGRPDLKDTINRLTAFADAGADVVFAPGLKTHKEVMAVLKAVHPVPVNVLMGIQGCQLTVDELADMGVKRISLGSSLIRAAYGGFIRAVEEVKQQGTFKFAQETTPYASLNEIFKIS